MTSASQFEMNSGSITGNEVGDSFKNDHYTQYASDLWIGANANGALTSINGGKIGNIFVNSNKWSEKNPGSFTMSGGSVDNIYVEYDKGHGATFTYSNGTIDHLYLSTIKGNGGCIEVTPVAGTSYKGGVPENPVAQVGSSYYDTVESAIAANKTGTVVLLNDTIESVTIPADANLTLDLNGHKIVDSATAQDETVAEASRKHTITNNGTLTILDSVGGGIVDNVSHGRAAIYNAGTITEIKNGKFTRSVDASIDASSANGNSWYVVYNDTNATISKISGGEFLAVGKFTSLLCNSGSLGAISAHSLRTVSLLSRTRAPLAKSAAALSPPQMSPASRTGVLSAKSLMVRLPLAVSVSGTSALISTNLLVQSAKSPVVTFPVLLPQFA